MAHALLDIIIAEEDDCRLSQRLDEHSEREAVAVAWERSKYEERHIALALGAEPTMTVFKENIIGAFPIHPTKPLAELERTLIREQHEAWLAAVGADRSKQPRHGNRYPIRELPSATVAAAPPLRAMPYAFRALMREEADARDVLAAEEKALRRHLARWCFKGLEEIVNALLELPAEFEQHTLYRLNENARAAHLLEPALIAEEHERVRVIYSEAEARHRLFILRVADQSFTEIQRRFFSVMASIDSFQRCQGMLSLELGSVGGLRERYFKLLYRWTRARLRERSIFIGLGRLRERVKRCLLRRYCAYWSWPIQHRKAKAEIAQLSEEEARKRTLLVFNEPEQRGRTTIMTAQECQLRILLDDHYALFEPLVAGRRVAAAGELSYLNAVRHAKVRLQTMFAHALLRRNEARIDYLRRRQPLYHLPQSVATWRWWAERAGMLTRALRIKRERGLFALEASRRLAITLQRAVFVTCIRAKARRLPPSPQSLLEAAKYRLALLRWEAWLSFAGRQSPDSAAELLLRRNVRRAREQILSGWLELRRARWHTMFQWYRATQLSARLILCEQAAQWAFIVLLDRALRGVISLRRILLRGTLFMPQERHYHLALRFQTWLRAVARAKNKARASRQLEPRPNYWLLWSRFIDWAGIGVGAIEDRERNHIITDEGGAFSRIMFRFAIEGASVMGRRVRGTINGLLERVELSHTRMRMTTLFAFLERRRHTHTCAPEVMAMANRLSTFLLYRYFNRWRWTIRQCCLAGSLQEIRACADQLLLLQYFRRLAPANVRASKMRRARAALKQAQIAVQKAAEKTQPQTAPGLSLELNLRRPV